MGPSAEQQSAIWRQAGARADAGRKHRRPFPGPAIVGRPPRRLELMAESVSIRARNTCRLVPSLYPSAGILDRVATPEDLPFVLELETWTNDRISTELGIL